jgi:hypothetical protein
VSRHVASRSVSDGTNWHSDSGTSSYSDAVVLGATFGSQNGRNVDHTVAAERTGFDEARRVST